MKLLFILITFLIPIYILAQPNCEAYLFYGDTTKYNACKQSEKTRQYYQFSDKYQKILNKSLIIDSTFAYAYRAKSTAYLKSGDFIGWKKLIDKAVLYDPLDNLGYRGWCRFQFFRDYKGAIQDFTELEKIIPGNIGYSINGDYHLKVAKALCYKKIGSLSSAINIMRELIADSTYLIEKYDYMHLGVMYLECGDLDKAKECFLKQEHIYDIAESRFYLSSVCKASADNLCYQTNKSEAKRLYLIGRRLFDPYVEYIDEINQIMLDEL